MTYLFLTLGFSAVFLIFTKSAHANMIFPPELIVAGLGIALLVLFVLGFFNAAVEYGVWKLLFRKKTIDWKKYRKTILGVNIVTFVATQILAWLLFAVVRSSASSIESFYSFPWYKLLPEVIPFFAEYMLFKKKLPVFTKQEILRVVLVANIVTFIIGLTIQGFTYFNNDYSRMKSIQRIHSK